MWMYGSSRRVRGALGGHIATLDGASGCARGAIGEAVLEISKVG